MVSASEILNASILVVDDQAADVSLLERMLRGAGYTSIASTMDPHEVCELQRKNRYCLILLDLQMPGMDGFQVMEGLKDIEKDAYLPVLVITAQPGHKLRALQAGAKDFISKPFDLAEVLTRVRNMLEVRLLHVESKKVNHLLEKLMIEMREVNERLVVGTIRAHTMTEVAEQANHLKDEFLATVSHELRTPLNAILGWARMLGAKQLPPDRTEKGIATIERNAVALAHIIDDLLDVSRIVAGTLRLAPQPVDLVAVAQAALDVVRPLAVTKNVQLAFSPNLPAIETVSGDAGRLEQVIWNLLANAIKFTPEGGRVDVRIAPSKDHLEVSVVDTGQGISPDFLPHVFDRFRQADGATTQRHTGLGLGLAIVRQLVELHGGTVHAASQGVGRGATFTVRLPISAGEAQVAQTAALGERRTAASAASPMPRLPRLDGLRILVVDDDPDGRTLTSLVLTQAGANVKAVASVREALQWLEVERPDAMVSDIGLPDEDGYGLIGQIRQYEAEHGGFLPAVALTGYARAEDRARVLAAGFQAHVPKPVEPAELTATIATITHLPRDGEQ
jgi:signal transduction histidine kinase